MGRKRLDFEYLPLDKIDISEHNVRRSKVEKGIDELAESIKEIGVQQPVMVFPKGDRWELIIGQRRYLACKKLGEKEIPAVITGAKNATQAAIASFSENIHRQDLDYRDKMEVAIRLYNQLRSVEKVAKRLGVSSQTVRNYMGYKAVPEPIKRMVEGGKLSAATATRITRGIGDEEKAIGIAEKIVEVPRSEDREKIIASAKENPDKSIAEVVKIAEKSRFRQVTVDLTASLAEALEQACKDYESDPKDLAAVAVEEWLYKEGYI
ncbi:MAG: ParB/RepB/Spo0J family partition protein [Anaerolineae bacterium]|nr:ParB/RepB/Spo0J family partition protein [Anaerolineae bacterium]